MVTKINNLRVTKNYRYNNLLYIYIILLLYSKIDTSLWTVITDYFYYFQTMDIFIHHLFIKHSSTHTLGSLSKFILPLYPIVYWLTSEMSLLWPACFQRGSIFVQFLRGEWLKVKKKKEEKKRERDREYIIIIIIMR